MARVGPRGFPEQVIAVAIVSGSPEDAVLGRELSRERRIRVLAVLDSLSHYLAVPQLAARVLLLDPAAAGPDHVTALVEASAATRIVVLVEAGQAVPDWLPAKEALIRPIDLAEAFAVVLRDDGGAAGVRGRRLPGPDPGEPGSDSRHLWR